MNGNNIRRNCQNIIWFISFVSVLLLIGCGRKEPPQLINTQGPPIISQLDIDQSVNVVRLVLRLSGGTGGIGYQIDRSDFDPYCKCPNMWVRYFEQQPSALNANKEIIKIIRIEMGKYHFLYRVRAIDSEGHLGPWSKMIHAESLLGHE